MKVYALRIWHRWWRFLWQRRGKGEEEGGEGRQEGCQGEKEEDLQANRDVQASKNSYLSAYTSPMSFASLSVILLKSLMEQLNNCFRAEHFSVDNSKSRKKKTKLPGEPKRPMSAYFLWLNEEGRDQLKASIYIEN